MPTDLAYIVLKAAKAAGATVAGFGGLIIAQAELGELAGNITLIALLAVLVGRYTFRQLEDYRQDLRHSRELVDRLELELEDLHRHNRELEEYAGRLRGYITAAGIAELAILDAEVPRPRHPGA